MKQLPQNNFSHDLGRYGLIRVSGSDAVSFLHAQLSNSIEGFGSDSSRLAAWCNAKGRVLALFRVFRDGDDVCLRLPRSLLDVTLQRLRMFVLRSQVSLEDASTTWDRLGLTGPGIEHVLKDLLGDYPAEPDQVTRSAGLILLRVAGHLPRIEIHGEAAAIQAFRGKLQKAGCEPAPTPDSWQLQEILAGLPEIHPQTREAFVPQMLNLHWLQGIDFRKGCYPGQEIVARMQYLGQLKRRMYLAQAESADLPAAGSNVYGNNGETAGTVVEAARADDGHLRLLAVLQIEATGQPLYLEPGGTALKLLELPYPISVE